MKVDGGRILTVLITAAILAGATAAYKVFSLETRVDSVEENIKFIRLDIRQIKDHFGITGKEK